MTARAWPPKSEKAATRTLPWRGLSREEAATYIGIGTSLFDMMVADGRMPKPKRLRGDPGSESKGRTLWDIRALDRAFDALPTDAEESGRNAKNWDANPWDEDAK